MHLRAKYKNVSLIHVVGNSRAANRFWHSDFSKFDEAWYVLATCSFFSKNNIYKSFVNLPVFARVPEEPNWSNVKMHDITHFQARLSSVSLMQTIKQLLLVISMAKKCFSILSNILFYIPIKNGAFGTKFRFCDFSRFLTPRLQYDIFLTLCAMCFWKASYIIRYHMKRYHSQ